MLQLFSVIIPKRRNVGLTYLHHFPHPEHPGCFYLHRFCSKDKNKWRQWQRGQSSGRWTECFSDPPHRREICHGICAKQVLQCQWKINTSLTMRCLWSPTVFYSLLKWLLKHWKHDQMHLFYDSLTNNLISSGLTDCIKKLLRAAYGCSLPMPGLDEHWPACFPNQKTIKDPFSLCDGFCFGMCAHTVMSMCSDPLDPLHPSITPPAVLVFFFTSWTLEAGRLARSAEWPRAPPTVPDRTESCWRRCPHSTTAWFLRPWFDSSGARKDPVLRSGRTNAAVHWEGATSERRRVETERDFSLLSLNLHCYPSLAPAWEAHSQSLHKSCELNFASTSEAAAAVRHFQSPSLISGGRPRHLSYRSVKDQSLGANKVHFHVGVL